MAEVYSLFGENNRKQSEKDKTMKSIRYLLGGKPHTMADCLDRALKDPPGKVTLELMTDESITEMHICQQFIGVYCWHFRCGVVRCHEVYGSVFLPCSQEDHRAALANANRRLRRRLNKLRARGIKVPGGETSFFQYPERAVGEVARFA